MLFFLLLIFLFVQALIIYGEKDNGGRKTSEDMLSAIPNSELHMIKQGSHPCYLDDPDDWHNTVISWLEKNFVN